ncbi:biotin/lipoyl-binding protein [Pedobacter panaciterrae]
MKTIQLLSLLGGMLLFEACSPTQSQTQEETIQEYPVSTVQPKDAVLNTDYSATIQGQQNIEIRPKVDGFVEQILVDEGAVVKKGQLLFKINAPSTNRRLEQLRPP